MPRTYTHWCPVWFATSRICVLREEPAESGGTPASASAPTTNVTPVTGIRSQQPAHLLHVRLVVHPVHHRAGAQEHQRLVERVGHQHEERDRVRPQPAAMNM